MAQPLPLCDTPHPAPGARQDALKIPVCLLAAGWPWACSSPSLVLYHIPY